MGEEEGKIKVLDAKDWWWGGWATLSFVALVLNAVFLAVVVKNRHAKGLRTFLTATLVTLTVFDILDICRIVPSIITNLHQYEEFRLVYCYFGVFHTVGVSGLILMTVFYLCCPCRERDSLHYPATRCRGSLPQKLLLPLLVAVSAGAAAVMYLLPDIYKTGILKDTGVPHSCINPLRTVKLISSNSTHYGVTGEARDEAQFWSDVYQTLISIVWVALPLILAPPAIVVAIVRGAVKGGCCQDGQRVGEPLLVVMVLIFYLGSIVAVILPKMSDLGVKIEGVDQHLTEVPVLWEVANAAARPLIYFCCNPAVWDGLKTLCVSTKGSYGSVSTKEDEAELTPVRGEYQERVSSL